MVRRMKNMTVQEFARLGALAVNGKRSKEERVKLAKKAARARWKKHKESKEK